MQIIFFPPFSFLARPLAWVQQHLQKLFHAFAEACSTTRVSRQRNGAIRHAALPGLFLSDSLRGDNGISADEKVGKVEVFFPPGGRNAKRLRVNLEGTAVASLLFIPSHPQVRTMWNAAGLLSHRRR